MHQQAYEWVDRHADADAARVLDIGGRNINGTIRDRFPGAVEYVVLDIIEDAGVDIVADAATWRPDGDRFDAVVCAEVFEHTPVWREICATAFDVLAPGGQFVATMAGPGRAPHSAMDGGPLQPGEHYANIDPDELAEELYSLGFRGINVDQLGEDVRCVAWAAYAPAVDRG